MPDDSWVKLYRSVDRAGWRKNPSILSVYVWILTHVNTGETPFDLGGISLKKGQAAATVGSIATACGLTYDGARHALKTLNKSGDIGVEHVRKCVRITLLSEKATPRSTPRSTPWCTPRSQEPEIPTESTPEDTSQSWSTPRSTPWSSPRSTPNTYPYISRDNQDIRQDYASTPPISPSFEEVRDYFRDHDYKRDPQRFYSYNQARGWTVKDWRAAADLWETYTDRQDRRDAKPTQKDTEASSSIDWDAVDQMVLEVPVFRKGDQKK